MNFLSAAPFIISILAAIHRFINHIRFNPEQFADMTGDQKRRYVAYAIEFIMDDNLDNLPFWSNLTEKQRDRILEGLVELVYCITSPDIFSPATTSQKRIMNKAFKNAQAPRPAVSRP